MLDSLTSAATPDCPRWSAALRHVAALTDRLGLPVDPGIRDAVAALSLAGFPTTQSCEGHVNAAGHGLPSPWVELDLPRAERDVGPPRLIALLARFNAARATPPEATLLWDTGRLQAGDTYDGLDATRRTLRAGRLPPDEVRALQRTLRARQAEMQAFAAFLRNHTAEVTAAPSPGDKLSKQMDRPMRTPDFQPRDQDERDRDPPIAERQALFELLAAREQAPEPAADLAWITDRFEPGQ
jgi:hypothetical protein